MKKVLQLLYEHKNLNREEARQVLVEIGGGRYNPAQVASFMTVYCMRSITVEELAGFRDAMQELCLRVDLEDYNAIDIVGTGGDGKNTFNISTLSSFIVAGAGYPVTKHGNYGVSSVSGSSNVLENLGYTFSNDPDKLRRDLDKAGICFLHAPLFHPAMKTVAPVRKELGMKTFFNMLGPLVNPSFPKNQFLGVFSMELARLYAYLYQRNEQTNYSIVHALDGYDEISLTGPFKLYTKAGESIFTHLDLGLAPVRQEDITGGSTTEEATEIFRQILEGKGSRAQKEVAIANAGLAIGVLEKEKSIAACIEIARESLESGKAYNVLKLLVS